MNIIMYICYVTEPLSDEIHMWQSCVVIPSRILIASLPLKRHIAELPLRTDEAHMRFIHSLDIRCIYEAHMSPTLNGSSAVRHFKHRNAIEIRNGITFDFYTGLPHIY